MSKNNPYKSFTNYILRTPLFSFSSYKLLTSNQIIGDDDFINLFNNPVINEALFLASPSFYEEIKRWLNGEIEDKKKVEKLKFSILKYITRMSSRCTPFGLFAGCAVGSFGENTKIEVDGANKNERHTRLDMNYLVSLSQDLVKNDTIRAQLLFTPNSSIYNIGNQLRYIEYKYFNSKRQHQIVAVDDSEYLNAVLKKASEGAKLEDLAKILVNDDISIEEAKEFIDELVYSQLLISELEPAVSGPEFLDQIYSVLKKLDNIDDILITLQKADEKLSIIDKTIGNNPKDYIKLSEFLEQLKTTFDLKFLFQSDLVLNCNENTINKEIIEDIKKGLTLFNKITIPPQTTLLSKFKDAFYERYEEREVMLSNALDVEIGIGYKQGQNSGDVNPLVDDLIIPGKTSKHNVSDIKWSSINALFQKLLIKALKEDAYTITLDANDFKDLDVNWNDLPDTFSSMVELIIENGKEKIKISSAGGSSAANLLGRFCHGDEKLHNYTQKIIDTETKINNNKLLAEIAHLPESRVGNILMRPDLREYEIPYLAKSIKPKAQQLPIDDLMLSVKNNRTLYLRSKKHNKEVRPHLTNAHNYSGNASLPIYHFLSDLQTQNIRGGIALNLGPFASDYEFLPRIEYLNLILHDATWNLKKTHIEPLQKTINSDKDLLLAIQTLRDTLKIPQFVMLADGDNELLINFDNITSVKMLLNTVNKRSSFKLTEFLFSNEGIVTKKEEYYTNQVIVSFYNAQKLNNAKTNSNA
ncbi:lantibiotic dehydratase family protein [uncultured Lacinutrix sp.]|uniref:lantibiotic dehydratase family protein n=1 Tax=uncultured Lacinutrix sp. TaxID=574032 RepID=UPI0026313081|nr:lantibiotic dehydratase family protein [uncultured Lacinutrix sp.]